MNDFPELKTPFKGCSYLEMLDTLDHTIYYPLKICSHCGNSHVDFKELTKCQKCGGNI